MKIVAVSLDYTFKDYKELSSILRSVEKDEDFSEFVGFNEPLLLQYKNEFRSPIQFFKIDWGNIIGAENIKENKYGKPYNADAPMIAAKQVAKYATHIVKIGKGNFSINKCASELKLPEIQIKSQNEPQKNKKYKF